MMSERKIAENFNSIWKANFPMLTSNYIRVFNASKLTIINTKDISKKENLRFDIVAELSFLIVKYCFEHKVDLVEMLEDEITFNEISKETALRIWKVNEIEPKFTELELSDIRDIASATINFINSRKPNTIEFEPQVKGYGLLPDFTADLALDETLFEIKTVKRTFRSSDLKQLLIYLALNQVADKPRDWKNGGLYNPRRSLFSTFKIDSFIFSISGGRSVLESFDSLLNSFQRDIQIHQRF